MTPLCREAKIHCLQWWGAQSAGLPANGCAWAGAAGLVGHLLGWNDRPLTLLLLVSNLVSMAPPRPGRSPAALPHCLTRLPGPQAIASYSLQAGQPGEAASAGRAGFGATAGLSPGHMGQTLWSSAKDLAGRAPGPGAASGTAQTDCALLSCVPGGVQGALLVRWPPAAGPPSAGGPAARALGGAPLQARVVPGGHLRARRAGMPVTPGRLQAASAPGAPGAGWSRPPCGRPRRRRLRRTPRIWSHTC